MDRLVKNYLKKIISETRSQDVGEMAYRPADTRDDEKYVRTKPLFRPENPTPIQAEGVPDAWIFNPEVIGGSKGLPFTEFDKLTLARQDEILAAAVLIVPIDCESQDEFLEKDGNRDWVNTLKEQYNLEPLLEVCQRKNEMPVLPKFATHIEKTITGMYRTTGKKMSAQEYMKRYDVFQTLEAFFSMDQKEGKEMLSLLNQRSIPIVEWDMPSWERKKYENQHLEKWDKYKIRYESHNSNSYETLGDFLQSVYNRIEGGGPINMRTYSLARQYNETYPNWPADRKNQEYWSREEQLKADDKKVLTPKYGLPLKGYTPDPLDVTVRMDLVINGEKTEENVFVWTITMDVKLGKILAGENGRESGIGQGFKDVQKIEVVKNVEIDPNEEISDVAIDPNVSKGLQEALLKFKEEIKKISPDTMLTHATIRKYKGVMNENKLVKKIIQKLLN